MNRRSLVILWRCIDVQLVSNQPLPILALGLPGIEPVNDSLLYGASPGAIVSTLEAADKRVAVGNADLRFGIPDGRQFALAAMGSTGQIAAGRVGPKLW